MNTYTLVNPYIVGDLEKSYTAETPIKAGEKAWRALSKYITGNLPEFTYSLRRDTDKKLYHLTVKEKISGDNANSVTFSIKRENKVKLSKDSVDKFNKKIDSFMKQPVAGGKKKSSSSSSSDSLDLSLLDYKYLRQPIVRWLYTPTIYPYMKSIYVPTFTVPLSPYVSIYGFDNYYLYY